MSISLSQPQNNEEFQLEDTVVFQGTVNSPIAKVEFLADDRWSLPRATIVGDRWSVSYQFNTSGKRKITIQGFDNDNTLIDTIEVQVIIQNQEFNFPVLTNTTIEQELTLWATYYYVQLAQENIEGIPLLDSSGNVISPKISERDWCAGAVEGTIGIKNNSDEYSVYNYAGVGSTVQANCRQYYPGLSESIVRSTNKVRFKMSNGAYGEGTSGLILVPYRSIAVDRSKIAIGSLIFIPEARGKEVVLPSRKTVTHDGYFYAADVGGAIRDYHIDVFLGVSNQNPFPFIRSNSSGTFSAYLIQDEQISNKLKAAHQAT